MKRNWELWVAGFCVVLVCALAWVGYKLVMDIGVPQSAFAAGSFSGRPRQVFVDGELTPMGYHQYTDLDTSCDLTDHGTFTIPAKAHLVLIVVEGQNNIRWRDYPRVDGDTTDPTAAIGMPIYAGGSLWYCGNLMHIEFIEEAAGAIMNVSFYGL